MNPRGRSPVFPHVTVKLSGEDGNAYAILVRVKRAMRRAGIPDSRIAAFVNEATESDYDHLLATCEAYVNVE